MTHTNAALSFTGLLVVAALLLLFPPDRYGFYPQCPIFAATGLLCPGCGGTRALAALLHGDVQAAWKWNALIVSLLPFAGVWAVLRTCRKDVRMPQGAWAGIGLIVAAFGICRNV